MRCFAKAKSGVREGNQNYTRQDDTLQVIGVNGGGDLEQSLDGAKF